MEKKYDAEKFNAVWERVMPAGNDNREYKEPTHAEMAETLRMLIMSKAKNSEYYKVLARRYSGKKVGRTFLVLSREEAEHLKKLQTVYYILTGDTYALKNERIKITSVLSVLRECFLSERESEKAFILASLHDNEPKRTRLFTKIADDEKRHADILEELIENTL